MRKAIVFVLSLVFLFQLSSYSECLENTLYLPEVLQQSHITSENLRLYQI
jgi:hypothetical protein